MKVRSPLHNYEAAYENPVATCQLLLITARI